MPSSLHKTCTGAFALFMALWLSGGHLLLLQVTAWSGMMVARTMESGVTQALESTFDGQHPCRLCKAIKKAHGDEQKPSTPVPLKSLVKFTLDVTLSPDALVIAIPPFITMGIQQATTPALSVLELEPSVPPPRVVA